MVIGSVFQHNRCRWYYILYFILAQDKRQGGTTIRSFNDQALEVICNLDDPQTSKKRQALSRTIRRQDYMYGFLCSTITGEALSSI